VDTLEHITDFDSAADLTLTLRKFQELGLPLHTNPPRQLQSQPSVGRSVFEEDLDNTDPKALLQNGQHQQRWKFAGPWVTGMSQGDFMSYVTKQLRARKSEFFAYVKERSSQRALSDARSRAVAEGSIDEAEEAASEIIEEDFNTLIKKLRSEFDLNSDLARYLTEFLDLPTTSAGAKASFADAWGASEKGPPKTHLSGGLSYLKSNAIIENHPIFGPQAHRKPFQARVLIAPSTDYAGNRGDMKGVIGIAGFAAEDPVGASVNPRIRVGPKPAYDNIEEQRDKMARTIGVGTVGGNRFWVNPTRASVDENGKVRIQSENADKTSVGVHIGELRAPDMPVAPARTRTPLGMNDEGEHRANQRLDSPEFRLAQGRGGSYGLEDENIRSLEQRLKR